jgi:hypothetical protein
MSKHLSADGQSRMIDWYTVLWGDEECRKTGAWHRNTCHSKERALNFARVYLQQGKIVFAIEQGDQIVMDEAAVLKHFEISQSK